MRNLGKMVFDDAPQVNGNDDLSGVKVATIDPTPTDDSSEGYYIGYKWVNTTVDTIHICVDDTVDAAKWEDVSTGSTGGTGSGGGVTGPNTSTDNAIATFKGTSGDEIQNSTVILDTNGNITGVNTLEVGSTFYLGAAATGTQSDVEVLFLKAGSTNGEVVKKTTTAIEISGLQETFPINGITTGYAGELFLNPHYTKIIGKVDVTITSLGCFIVNDANDDIYIGMYDSNNQLLGETDISTGSVGAGYISGTLTGATSSFQTFANEEYWIGISTRQAAVTVGGRPCLANSLLCQAVFSGSTGMPSDKGNQASSDKVFYLTATGEELTTRTF